MTPQPRQIDHRSLPASGPFLSLIDALDCDRRLAAFQSLARGGFIGPSSVQAWLAEMQQAGYHPRRLNHLLAPMKLRLDDLLERTGGEISLRKGWGIVERLRAVLRSAGESSWLSPDQLARTTTIDFGAGLFSPLCASLILYANGAARAIALEPFDIDVPTTVAALENAVRHALFHPERIDIGVHSPQQMRQRIAALALDGLAERLQAFSDRQTDRVDLGGVELTRRLPDVWDTPRQLVFSTSVLEHVDDLGATLCDLANRLGPEALCVHTVDYSDHRAQGSELDLFEMYYDGVLDGINGLRPPQIEDLMHRAGFRGQLVGRLMAPPDTLQRQRGIHPRHARFNDLHLTVFLCSYVLRRLALPTP